MLMDPLLHQLRGKCVSLYSALSSSPLTAGGEGRKEKGEPTSLTAWTV